MTTQATTKLERLKAFLNTLNCEHIDLAYFADENVTSYDELQNAIDRGAGFNVDIIYYSRAIEYLKENDPSLKSSLEIASFMGYACEDLSSETLASLHASEQARTDFADLEDEIAAFFDELNAETEEDDDSEAE